MGIFGPTSVADIVRPLTKIADRLEAHAEAKRQEYNSHLDVISEVERMARAADQEVVRAKEMRVKLAAFLGGK